MEKIFNGTSVKECIEIACKELNVEKEHINFKVLEEKKGLLRRTASIMVEIPDTPDMPGTPDTEKINPDNGSIRIRDGKIYVTNPSGEGKQAEIIPSSMVTLKVNGEVVREKVEISESDLIEYSFEEYVPSRKMNINIAPDKMEAYVSINYSPKVIYKLKDLEESNRGVLECIIADKVWPPMYKENEIKQELLNHSISYGIVEENISKCTANEGVENLIIAKGKEVKDSEPDFIEIKFRMDKDLSNLSKDSKTNIDYKSIGAVEAVNKGDILAIKHNGEEGKDGKDITGVVKKHKEAKKVRLKAGSGCTLKGDNTIISDIQGKPCIKNNVYYVFPVHELNGDVDIKTGNIKFVGDVIIHGSVTDGMAIESGNAVNVDGNVLRATIKGKGNLDIKGNISNSEIFAGGEDVYKLEQIQCLTNLHEYLDGLIKTVEEVKKFNLLGYNTSDGEIIKVLIENKFKKLPRLCLNYITSSTLEHGTEEDSIIYFLKNKLIGLAPLNIKHYSELEDFGKSIISKMDLLKNSLSIPVTVRVGYCQESNVSSSGDIFVVGKGALTCHVNANNAIEFISDNSVVRGCIITANNEIRCKTVGSSAGVSTKLIVKSKGHIYVDIAYQNTTFIVGNKEMTLETPSKSIHAYLNDNLELVVDKLKL